jgi:hypothetical protein
MEKITARTITDVLANCFAEKKTVSKEKLLDAAMKLSVLALDEVATLTQMEQDIAKTKVAMLEAQEKRNVSEVDLRIEATDAYRDMRRQKAFCEAIEEMIITARHSAKLNEFA